MAVPDPVSIGSDFVEFPGASWNELVAEYRRQKAKHGDFLPQRSAIPLPHIAVTVKNETAGGAREPGQCLKMAAPIIDPAARPSVVWEPPTIEAVEVLADDEPFLILKDYMTHSTVKEAVGVISGLAWAKLYVDSESHTFAEPGIAPTAQFQLRSNSSGPAKIIWKESGTGDNKWALVLISQPQGQGTPVDPGSLAPGCGIDFDGTDVVFAADEVADFGLTNTETCKLGLYDTNYNALGGFHIYTGFGTDNFQWVSLGCGLEIADGTLRIRPQDLVSDTVFWEGIDTYCQLGATGGGGGGGSVSAGCGITVTGGDTVAVNAATLAGNGLGVQFGCTLQVNVNSGGGLAITSDHLVVVPSDLAGCGLTTASDNQSDQNGPVKLIVDVASIAGCGLAAASDNQGDANGPCKLVVDPSAIAGDGLTTQAGNQGDGNGPCKIRVVGSPVTINHITGGSLTVSGTTVTLTLTGTAYQVYGTSLGAMTPVVITHTATAC